MPRIYTSQSDPIDFCLKCFPKEESAKEQYANLGDGPDNRGNCFDYNADHPPYQDDDYTCEKCNKKLTKKDDYLYIYSYLME